MNIDRHESIVKPSTRLFRKWWWSSFDLDMFIDEGYAFTPRGAERKALKAFKRRLRAENYGTRSKILHERNMQWAKRVQKETQGTIDLAPAAEQWKPIRSSYDDSAHDGMDRKEWEEKRPSLEFKPNLYISKTEDGTHKPAIDLDVDCKLVPSRTPGHWHLYIDKEMSWESYKSLLRVMANVGIIEKGYYEASVKEGCSALRIPPMEVLNAEAASQAEALADILNAEKAEKQKVDDLF